MKRKVSWLRFVSLLTLIYCLVFVTSGFADNPVIGWRGFMEVASHWCVVAVCCFGVLGAMAVSRLVFAVAFPLLLLISSALLYFQLTMHADLTPTVVELMVINDFSTWATVMSPLLVVCVFVVLALGVTVAVYRWKRVSVSHPLDSLMLSLLLMVTPFCFVKRFKAPVGSRMPFVFYTAVDTYLANKVNINEDRDNFEHVPVSAPPGDMDVVVVIGESLRADHLSLNGYPRPTTPLLEADSNVVSFPLMRSIPCFTHVSVPYLLTLADSVSPGRAYEEQSFITLFRNAGFSTAWISNQDTAPSYAYFMHECDTLLHCGADRSLYSFDRWLDSDILPRFDALPRDGKRLTVVHSIGSHWWYPSHYEEQDAVFSPEVKSRILSEVSDEELVNSYDNTVVATDRFLHALTERLKDRNAVLVYISDHGEALGEDGHYLHGADYPQLHNPACLIWYSDSYARLYPEKVEALRKNSSLPWRSESIFHTVLDAASLSTEVKADSLSLFKR